MKKLVFLLFMIFITTVGFAKKVKFAVDLSGIVVNPLGVHVTGDFQSLAGFGSDWMPNTTPLTKEAGSDIYSIIVDIPAFARYEYKFLNGDQWYDSEFVPVESRVENPINDNRWIYVDSLSNDTTFIGAIVFSGNAPLNKYLLRLRVDMQNQIVNSTYGVHVAGNFTAIPWQISQNRMINLNASLYELIIYTDSNNFQYKFYNGNTVSNSEIIPSACAVNGNREVLLNKDTVMDIVCFSECNACVNGISNNSKSAYFTIFPNPAKTSVNITLDHSLKNSEIIIYDVMGKLVKHFSIKNIDDLVIERDNLPSGLYFVKIQSDNSIYTKQLLFN